MGDARSYWTIPGTFEMVEGELSSPTLAFETWGTLNQDRDNAVLIFTGLSPSAHVASSANDSSDGWWQNIVGPKRAIDTDRYFVVCVNSLGSCYGSTGPASPNPDTGETYRLTFPTLHLEDVAAATHAVVLGLGVDQLFCTVGPSMGGMTALAYASKYPSMSKRLIIISAATTSRPQAIAFRSLQRDIVRSDPNWRNGNYTQASYPHEGMRLARKLGMITYRSANEWNQRFTQAGVSKRVDSSSTDPWAIEFEVESYLDVNARKFTQAFDANCYLYLSRAMDLFNLKQEQTTLREIFAGTKLAKTLIIGVISDFLFPQYQQQALAKELNQNGITTQYTLLDSIQGHDSFLVDTKRFGPVIADFMQQ